MRLLVPTTLGLFVATAGVLAQAPPNDECSGAFNVVEGLSGPFNNNGATQSAPTFTCALPGNDVWFVYVASCTGTLTADTCSAGTNFDTAIRIFDTTCQPCGSFTASAACNDDFCGLRSSVSIPCVQGTTYYISVGGFAGAQGNFDLTVGCTPVGGGPADDECSRPTALNLGVNGTFSNVGYTTSSPPWNCALGGRDRWFTYTARCTAPHSFYTCSANSTLDTGIEVFSGSCNCGLTRLACGDDWCGFQSLATVNLTLGQTVLVRVGGFAGATGNFDLTVEVGTHAGLVNTYADACGGLGLATSGSPNINGAITSTLSGATGISGLGYGFARTGVNFCGTCVLGHDYGIAVIGSSFPLTIPCDPALIGARLFTQGFDLTAPGGCSALGISLSDTNEIVIG